MKTRSPFGPARIRPGSLWPAGATLLGLALLSAAPVPGGAAQNVAHFALSGKAGGGGEVRKAGVSQLTPADEKALRALFTKLRAATLRIEDCPPNDCRDPDGVGTAFLISADGLALTAYHVVLGSSRMEAVTSDKKRHSVTVVGYDDQSDVALLRVNVPSGTPFLPLAAARPAVGDVVLAIGNGDGNFLTPKTGRVLELDAGAGRADFPDRTLELNAPLAPGDSGGPVLNARGEAVGVASYISVQGRAQKVTSYAVPVTAGAPLLADLKRGIRREAPAIGIGLDGQFADLSDLSEAEFPLANRELDLGLGGTPGAFFTSVLPGSPAARAGLRPLKYDQAGKKISGDVVSAVDGRRIVNFNQFQYAVRAHQPGETLTLRVLRDGRQLDVPVTLVGRSTLRQ